MPRHGQPPATLDFTQHWPAFVGHVSNSAGAVLVFISESVPNGVGSNLAHINRPEIDAGSLGYAVILQPVGVHLGCNIGREHRRWRVLKCRINVFLMVISSVVPHGLPLSIGLS